MKTIVILSVLFLLVPVTAQAEQLSLQVAFDTPARDQTALGDVLTVPGASLHARPGEPLLPKKAFTFVLPQGHTPVSVRVESARAEMLGGAYDIAPAQIPVPLSGRFRPLITPKDALIYASGDAYPNCWAEVDQVHYKRGVALVEVIVHPLSYVPATGRVQRLVSATLVLSTRPGGKVSPLLRATDDDDAVVLRRADVSTALNTYVQKVPRGPLQLPPGDYPYVIVTPQAFENIGGDYSLEALRDVRTAAGMAGNIVTVEWIQANYDGTRPDGGQDDATRIRDFLTDAYMEWNTSYVLLVGDADADDVGGESGDDLLPVRGLYVNPQYTDAAADNLPSDMYYSCLDGSFDNDADGTYGEINDGPDGNLVDVMAELYVGRAPVDRVAEVQNFVAKTLYYEAGAGAWLQDVLMVGELLWEGVYGGDALDQLITGTPDTLGFDSFPFFECNTLYDRDMWQGEQWAAGQLVSLLNAGPHIVNHLGHSNVTYNMRLMNNHVDELVNVHPFLHYSQGCYNGAFDNNMGPEAGNRIIDQDCIAEHLVTEPNGALATVSNSRYGWGSFMASGPSQEFHKEFWDAFFKEGMSTIGEALVDSKEDNASSFADPIMRWVGYESNLLGDPAVAIKKSINTADSLLGVYPPQVLLISMLGEAAPDPVSVGVRNDGVGSLSFTAVCDQPWVTLTPDSGNAPQDVQVQVDPAELQPGTHRALVTFSSAEATNSPMEMSIVYVLVEVPGIQVPHIEQAPVVDGVIDAVEYAQALQISIDPNETGDVSLYLAASGSRLYVGVDDRLDPAEGEWDRMVFHFDRDLNRLWPSAPGNEGAYIVIDKGIGGVVFMPFFNPGSGVKMGFMGMEREPTGADGVIGFVDNHRVYEMALDLETSHLDVGPAGEFGMFVEVQNSEQMGGGTQTGSWPPVVPEMDTQRYFGYVDLTPQETWLHASPGDLFFEAIEEQAAPAPATLTVSELLGGTVSFSASSAESWLEVTPTSGQTPQDLTVTVDHSGLQPGIHQGGIILESSDTGNTQHIVPVTFEVLPKLAQLSVSPLTLEVSVAEGDTDPSTQFAIENFGGREMDVTLTAAETWITFADSFAVSPGATQNVAVQISLAGMTIGTYSADIVVDAPEALSSPQTVTVQLEIVRANTAPPAPVLMSPENGSQLYGLIDLMAYPVTDPEGDPVTYQFELMVSSTGDPVDSGAGVDNTGFISWQPTAQLEEDVLYRWRVRAADDRGAEGEWSEEWTFLMIKEPSSDDCGCGGSQTPSVGFMFFLMGLLFLRFSGRRG